MRSGEYTVVPVFLDFGMFRKSIGELRVLTAELPGNSDYVFSISVLLGSPVELMSLHIQTDDQYIGYLRQVGKLPAQDPEPSTFLTTSR